MRAAHPDRDIYFTKCAGLIGSDFAGDSCWMVRHLLIGATRHGARAVLLWNLALDEHGNPHTGAGAQCRGMVSVSASGAIERNVEYYALGHASRFVVPGARRIAATSADGLIETVAFKNPDGTKVLIALNDGDSARSLSVQWGGESFCYTLAAGAVATFTWRGEPTPTPLDMPLAPVSRLLPIAIPDTRLWARVRRWLGDQLQSLGPLIARRLGRHELVALVVGSAFLAFLVYRTIRRMRLRR